MSSKRDLVEAHSYNRRRLITAFVSGAPGGREVEPVRYGRTLVGGAVLAVMVVVGAAVSGFIGQPVPDDWAKRGLIVGKDTGTRYFADDGTLYPVLNYTSALLLLGGQDDGNATTVSEEKIASRPTGTTLGIPGAPEALPAATSLVQSGWTACTNQSGGVHVSIGRTPASRSAGDAATLVRNGQSVYAVIGEHRYAVPAGAARDNVLRAVGLDGQVAVSVPGTWLDLVPTGQPLEVPKVANAGQTVQTGVPGLDTVGTPVRVDGQPRVVGPKGELIPVSEFAYRVYLSSGLSEKKVSISQASGARTDNQAVLGGTDWPTQAPSPYTSPQSPCLLLTTATGKAAEVHLAVATTTDAAAPGSGTTRTVESGRGALVRATSGGVLDAGEAYLVDSTGTAYAIGGTEADTLTSLRLSKTKPVAVPKSWIDVLGAGPALSAQAAARGADAVQGQQS